MSARPTVPAPAAVRSATPAAGPDGAPPPWACWPGRSALVFCLPALWMLLTSLHAESDAATNPPSLFAPLTLDGYRTFFGADSGVDPLAAAAQLPGAPPSSPPSWCSCWRSRRRTRSPSGACASGPT